MLFQFVCHWYDIALIQMMLDHGAATDYDEVTLNIRSSIGETFLSRLTTNKLQDVARDIPNRFATNLNAQDTDAKYMMDYLSFRRRLRPRTVGQRVRMSRDEVAVDFRTRP